MPSISVIATIQTPLARALDRRNGSRRKTLAHREVEEGAQKLSRATFAAARSPRRARRVRHHQHLFPRCAERAADRTSDEWGIEPTRGSADGQARCAVEDLNEIPSCVCARVLLALSGAAAAHLSRDQHPAIAALQRSSGGHAEPTRYGGRCRLDTMAGRAPATRMQFRSRSARR